MFDGEYSYPRPAGAERVRSVLDIGCNLGSFIVWACHVWWPGQIEHVNAYDPNAAAVEIARLNTTGLPVTFHDVAVTSAAPPVFFREIENWGGARTYGETSGVEVATLHPRELPAADVLKVDGEGIEPEVFEHYQHWNGVMVAMFEYHDPSHREPVQGACRRAGLTPVRYNPLNPDGDVQVWVRRAA